MKKLISVSKTLFISTGICLFSIPHTLAMPTRLLTTRTTYNQTSAWGTTYYFTIKLPESLINWQLQQVVLTQIEGLENIEFDQKNSVAFVDSNGKKEKLRITLAKRLNQPQTLIVTFNQPIYSNQLITIGLKPFHNPHTEGIYQFRVEVISSDEKANNLVVGTARLQFYDDFYDQLFPRW
ncbi:DUF2808 domain-containing protein [Anabaena sp. FACHB-1237]|uniref:DUF2808 domain-containing protein n=1 Tax=Anabaena sp. FACHB-1237 TaxID=2692769 RepID=UPI0016802666|nr:DUF2808 domain-containing protein [Anabaena sp. FACHB-1237]MBD2139709.1 DUF2808 domain-containing protein [Anabaena sp. FACHB-1237]